jgi:signal transduction histidine kinase
MQAEAMRAEIAQERAHLLARFVQSASHEFRTPLAIIGTSLYLMTRQPDPTKRQSHSEVAEREIKRIEVLLEMFVNMVQLDTGVSLERIPTQIDLLVRSTMVKFEKAAFDHHINLQLNVSSPLPRIQIDPYYLTMALEQILDNAVRYTPDGGSIAIEVTAEDKWLVINVRDSGLGIADDELEHIFDRFWRHDKAHSTPGFGLGLSIVQKVIEQHQGTINIKSKVGQGTTVTLRLPV